MEAIITLWTLSDPHNAPIHSGNTTPRLLFPSMSRRLILIAQTPVGPICRWERPDAFNPVGFTAGKGKAG